MPVTFQDTDTASYAAGVLEADGRTSREWTARGGAKRRRPSESDHASLLDTATSALAWSATASTSFRSRSSVTHATPTFAPMEREPLTESEPWRSARRRGTAMKASTSPRHKFSHRGSRLSKTNASYLSLVTVAVLVLLVSAASPLRKGLLLLGQESSPASHSLPEAAKSTTLPSEVWGHDSDDSGFPSVPAPLKVQASHALGMSLEHVLLHSDAREAASFGSSGSTVRPDGMLHFDGTTSASYDASSFGSVKLWGSYGMGFPPQSAGAVGEIKSLGEREPHIEFEPWQRNGAIEAHAQVATKWSISAPFGLERFAPPPVGRVSLPDSDYAPESGSGGSTPPADILLEDWPSSSPERGLKMRTRNSDSESSSSGASGPTTLPPPVPPGRKPLGPLQEQHRSAASRKVRRRSGGNEGSSSRSHRKRSRPSRRVRSESGDSSAQAKPPVTSFPDKTRLQDRREPSRNASHRIPGAPPNSPLDAASQSSHLEWEPDDHLADEAAYEMQRGNAYFALDDKLNASNDASGEEDDSGDEEAISSVGSPDNMSRAPEAAEPYDSKSAMLDPSANNDLHFAGGDAASEGLPARFSSALFAARKHSSSTFGRLEFSSEDDSEFSATRPVFPDLPGANPRPHRAAFARAKGPSPLSTEALLLSVRQALEELVSSEKAD